MSVLVVGLGVTGDAVAHALRARGEDVVVVEDHPTEAHRRRSDFLDVTLVESPTPQRLAELVDGAEVVVPSPGVPDRHPVFAAAERAGVAVCSELDLAAAWDDRPTVAITGTDGKTTVTTLVTDILVASGVRAVAAGNTEVPLVTAIGDPATEVFVVEASSFRLGHSSRYAPRVGTWLNFAPDHLDVHASLEAYEHAKASIWARPAAEGVAVANADDAVVCAHLPTDRRVVRFGRTTGDYCVVGNQLVGDGGALVEVSELWRALPHDLSNALAAAATARPVGATLEGAHAALTAFRGLPHRVQVVTERNGITWIDDSKATTPHAALAALEGFASVVLIVGGRNKGLDLRVLADTPTQLRGVVAIGEAANEVAEALEARAPVRVAPSMDDAVATAASFARRGDVVLLSPGCTSFDWYPSYAARGDDFARAVLALLASGAQ